MPSLITFPICNGVEFIEKWKTSQLESIHIPSSVRTHGLTVEALIQHLCCVLHALRRHQVTRSDAEGGYKLNVCIVFYTHWGDVRVAKVRPGDGMNASFVLRFTCVEATSGYHKWCRGMIEIQSLCRVLHALRWHQSTISDANGWYQLNFCIVFYTHWGDIRVP